jgi:hypothetical protein
MLVTLRYQQEKGRGNRTKGKHGRWHYAEKSTNPIPGSISKTIPEDTRYLQNAKWFSRHRMQYPEEHYWKR